MGHHPECENCHFFIRDSKTGITGCDRHQVILPQIDWPLICKDWYLEGETFDLDLEESILYYYSFGTGELVGLPLLPFDKLKNFILSVSIRRDKEYGWVISPRSNLQYFPPPSEFITVLVGNRRCKFEVVSEQRNSALELFPTDEGWQAETHSRNITYLASLESPTLLEEWLNEFIDLKQLEADSLAPNILAFIEVVDEYKDYVLHADMLKYRKYAR